MQKPSRTETRHSRAERRRLETEQRREAEQSKEKTGRVPCNERKMREPEFAGEARSIQVRVVIVATRTQRKTHLEPLTQLTGAAHACSCIWRARERRRLRGTLQARGVYECVA